MKTAKIRKDMLARKESIEEDKASLSREEGARDHLTKTLKTKYNCSSVKKGEAKVTGLEKEASDIEKAIKKKVKQIDAFFEDME